VKYSALSCVIVTMHHDHCLAQVLYHILKMLKKYRGISKAVVVSLFFRAVILKAAR